MTLLYTTEVVNSLNSQWSQEKITIILDLISFLSNDKMAVNNVKSLENIINSIDSETQQILNNL